MFPAKIPLLHWHTRQTSQSIVKTERTLGGLPRSGESTDRAAYPLEAESPDAVGRQLLDVFEGDLHQAVGLRSSRRPVLVTLHERVGQSIPGASCARKESDGEA